MKRLGAVVAVAWVLASCSANGPTSSTSCTPGITVSCPCAGGSTGLQVCNRSGTFDACQCGAVDSGTVDGGTVDSGTDVPRPIDSGADVATPVDVPVLDAPPSDLGALEGGVDVIAPPDAGACAGGQTRCGGVCVDTQASALHCGACDRPCPAGQACSGGTCRPPTADCRTGGCPAMNYCDLGTGMCRPGCAEDSHCAATERCDFATRTCGCGAGTHRCGTQCVADASPATCGASCTPCPGGANATPACAAGSCGLTCNTGFHTCAGACASNAAVATCGARCDPCVTPVHGRATCVSERCDVACDVGYLPCSAGCCALTRQTISLGASPRDLTLSTRSYPSGLEIFYASQSGTAFRQGHQLSNALTGVWGAGTDVGLLAGDYAQVVGRVSGNRAVGVCGSVNNPPGSATTWQVECASNYVGSLLRFPLATGDANVIGSFDMTFAPAGEGFSVLVREVARGSGRAPTQWVATWTFGDSTRPPTLFRPEVTSASTVSALYGYDSRRVVVLTSDGAPACLRAHTYSAPDWEHVTALVGTTCEQATLIKTRSGNPSATPAPIAYATPSGSVRFNLNPTSPTSASETVDGPSSLPVTALDVNYVGSETGMLSYHVAFTRSDSQVYYAVRTATGWSVSSVSAALGGVTGSSPMVSMGDGFRPHVVFLSGGTGIDVTW